MAACVFGAGVARHELAAFSQKADGSQTPPAVAFLVAGDSPDSAVDSDTETMAGDGYSSQDRPLLTHSGLYTQQKPAVSD